MLSKVLYRIFGSPSDASAANTTGEKSIVSLLKGIPDKPVATLEGSITLDNGTPITGQTLPSGAGTIGWLSNLFISIGNSVQSAVAAGAAGSVLQLLRRSTADLAAVSAQLPATLGTKVATASFPVVVASDQTVRTGLGSSTAGRLKATRQTRTTVAISQANTDAQASATPVWARYVTVYCKTADVLVAFGETTANNGEWVITNFPSKFSIDPASGDTLVHVQSPAASATVHLTYTSDE